MYMYRWHKQYSHAILVYGQKFVCIYINPRSLFCWNADLWFTNRMVLDLQASVGLVISLLLLADLSLTLLTLLQFYSIGMEAVLVIVLVLPLALIIPSAAGLNALFSHGSRRSAGLARVYALWNVTSIVNMVSSLFIWSSWEICSVSWYQPCFPRSRFTRIHLNLLMQFTQPILSFHSHKPTALNKEL